MIQEEQKTVKNSTCADQVASRETIQPNRRFLKIFLQIFENILLILPHR